MKSWKERLADKIDYRLAEELEVFDTQMKLRQQDQLDEKIFAETRLRRGIYGQRYDNGQRHDGIRIQELKFPCGDLMKGPDTVWDAPGMQRIKIPFGGMNPDQLDCMAELAEEYADGILHVTTRQDIQLHYVHIEDTPSLMRRLAAVGITTREACGNSVRNVTACPFSGVCRDEVFDVTYYSRACAEFLLGHPDVQDFGRKVKIAFSGCADNGCGLGRLHDIAAIARIKRENGTEERGFRLLVGGGLGAVPHQAEIYADFVPVEELLPTTQAISRVFAKLGEKKQRSRARLKFLVAKLGIEEFRRIVEEERAQLPEDSRWTAFIQEALGFSETPASDPGDLVQLGQPEGFQAWMDNAVYFQKQQGYAVAQIALPLGDISAWQARRVSDLARRFSGDSIRLTVDQNIVLRWVSLSDLHSVYESLQEIGLAETNATTIEDITACPGTDTCKLGISSSRGLASEIRRTLTTRNGGLPEAAKKLQIKISGCFNSCGQHHIADLGFYGISRTIQGRKVPHFQVVLGGTRDDNAGEYGLAVGAVPARNIPKVIDLLTARYSEEMEPGERFFEWVKRTGKKGIRRHLEELMHVPAYFESPDFYSNWGDPREFTLGDMGIGECAGEVVAPGDFEMAAAERMVFEAQVQLDSDNLTQADQLAYGAMLEAVRGLVKTESTVAPADPSALVGHFETRYFDTGLFNDQFAGGKFGRYLLERHNSPSEQPVRVEVHRLIEEAQLFIEAALACRDRIAQTF